MGFDSGIGKERDFVAVTGSEKDAVVSAFRAARKEPIEKVCLNEPQMQFVTNGRIIGTASIGDAEGRFYAGHQAYRLDPKSQHWDALLDVFEKRKTEGR